MIMKQSLCHLLCSEKSQAPLFIFKVQRLTALFKNSLFQSNPQTVKLISKCIQYVSNCKCIIVITVACFIRRVMVSLLA